MAHHAIRESNCAAISCHNCGLYQLCLPMGLESADSTLLDRYVKRKRLLGRKEVLYRSGQVFTSVYAIRSGSVKTYISTDDGRLQITGFHVPGELLGLNALDEKRYDCEAMALETTSVCEISADCFDEMARQMPSMLYQMLRMMSREIKHNQDLMLLLGKKNAEERLATYLLSLSRRFALRNYSPTQFNLSMSRGDIGNYLGISEETVCRTFTRFQEKGVIVSERRHVILRDLEHLSAIAREHHSTQVIKLSRTTFQR